MKWSTLSYSQMNKLAMCPKQWEFKYIHKIPEIITGRNITGRCYHVAVAQAQVNKIAGIKTKLSDIHDVFDTNWNKELGIKPGLALDDAAAGVEPAPTIEIDWGEFKPGWLKDRGIKLVDVFMKYHLPKMNPLRVEYKIQRYVDNIKVLGYVDTELGPDDIADHKFKGREFKPEDLARDFQSSVYAMIVNHPLRTHFYQAINQKGSYKMPEPVSTFRGESDILWTEEMVRAYHRQIEAEIFPPAPSGWWCSPVYCPYWIGHCRWKI